jgi:hypothetical protein
MNLDINYKINLARKGISDFCIFECKAFCCRKGHLILNRKEFNVIIKDKVDEYKDRVTALEDGNFRFFIGKLDSPCPCLSDDFLCMIHKNRKRPRICKDFPILYINEIIYINKDCPAVQENKLYGFIASLKKENYIVRYI